jgi:hypothetical protein
MIKTEFVENAYDYAPDLVAVAADMGDRLDEHVQCLFVVTRVERLTPDRASVWERRTS